MVSQRRTQLTPRNGRTLMVCIVARISGCANQKELSLEDQIDHAKEIVTDMYDGPVEFHTISTRGKGERLDRPELKEVEDLIRTRTVDLVVMEDVGRMVRGSDAVRIWGIAVDHGTRCIAPNDCCDTAEDGWEEDLISACRDHVGHNAHTSKRLKHKLMNRFLKFGGATPRQCYGYIKPDGAKTYDDWQKDPAAAQVLQDGLKLLKEMLNCSAVADMFNERGVPVGPYCRRKSWDGAMVRRLFANPILKGQAGRGYRRTIKHHESGRRISVRNPDGPAFREYPHLAHLDAVEFDDINQRLNAKNEACRRRLVNGVDPLLRVPRKRTRFPGQHATCWYCGRQYVWGGNGITTHLQCSGCREWRCWNSVGFDGAVAAARIVEIITNELYQLDQFDDQFTELVETAMNRPRCAESREQLRKQEETLSQERKNFGDAIAQFGMRPWLQEQLDQLDARERELALTRRRVEFQANENVQVPKSAGELRGLFKERFSHLAIDSPELGNLMRLLVPEFRVYLVRLCDGGHLLPRARIKLSLAGIAPDARQVPGLSELLTREMTIDLFTPPQRERIRTEAASLASQGVYQREIARRLSERPKQQTVQKALDLNRQMTERGLSSPFVMLLEPPDDYVKLRRHRNPKYRFEPLEGYVRPEL